MKKKKLYRTVIQYEIISDEPYEGENLDEIVHETYNGSWSGEMKDAAVLNEELIGKKAVDAVKNQGSDPEFFFMDNGGNDISV